MSFLPAKPVLRVRCDPKAFELLGLATDASVEEVDSAWRTLRRDAHPDKGGNEERFDGLRRAYQSARFWALEPKRCPECDGTGDKPDARQYLKTCDACHGSGKMRARP